MALVGKVGPQLRLNGSLPSCLEITSMKDSLVSGAVVAELPLATACGKSARQESCMASGIDIAARMADEKIVVANDVRHARRFTPAGFPMRAPWLSEQ
jgi:hypothetical protein